MARNLASASDVKIRSSVRGSGALITSGNTLSDMAVPPGAIRVAQH
ncbi:hypothetical protein [Mesorhizobium sp.]|nr:hypothetical protein [Mesorhizobium sp.]